MPEPHMEELDDPECRRLLAQRHLGRLAIPDFGGPVIFPVNYVFDQDLVVFRTDPGSKLDAATERESVAFEVDAIDEATRTRLERGRPRHPGRHHRPRPPGAAPRPAAVPLGPWRKDPVRPRAAAVGQRPPHQNPRPPALHLVGLTGRLPMLQGLIDEGRLLWVDSAGNYI